MNTKTKLPYQKYQYQLLRTVMKIAILVFFVLGYHFDIDILVGNLSGAVLFGFIPLADPFAVLQIFASGYIAASKILIGAAVVLILYILFFGRAFCSWVCPVSIITELASFLRKKIKGDELGFKVLIRRSVRYWILALTIILSLIFSVAAFEFISPISILHRGIVYGMGLGWTIIIVVFLFDLFVVKDGFCGHICPLGAFYSLIARFSLIKVRFISSKCTDCQDCVRACPEPQVLPHFKKGDAIINSGECSVCARCIEVCETDALVWSTRL